MYSLLIISKGASLTQIKGSEMLCLVFFLVPLSIFYEFNEENSAFTWSWDKKQLPLCRINKAK